MEELKPVKFDKNGPLWCAKGVTTRVSILINADNSNYFTQRVKHMSKDIQDAKSLVDEHIQSLHEAIELMVKKEELLVNSAKTTTGRLRDTVHKLSDGLAKVEKTANFDKLARYADTLERIERALSSLAEMEKTGLLTKISSSLR